MGVVYYANYFVWFEVGRTDLLRDAGWSYRDMEAERLLLPVIEAHCAYRQSAKYDDELDVRTTGALLSPVRVKFSTRSCVPPTTRRWRPDTPFTPRSTATGGRAGCPNRGLPTLLT